jgi:hypothetical protein
MGNGMYQRTNFASFWGQDRKISKFGWCPTQVTVLSSLGFLVAGLQAWLICHRNLSAKRTQLFKYLEAFESTAEHSPPNLRRGLLCTCLTSGNVPPGALPGHVSGHGPDYELTAALARCPLGPCLRTTMGWTADVVRPTNGEDLARAHKTVASPTRFPTMLADVHRRPPPSATCLDAYWGGRR